MVFLNGRDNHFKNLKGVLCFFGFGFIICTSLIVYSGTKLSKYGDIIAEKTGWAGRG